MLRPTESAGATCGRARGAGRGAALAAIRRLDLRHDPCARVEELLLHLRPAADVLDREQLQPDREVEPLRDTVDHRPVAVLGEGPLRRLRAQELEEGLRLLLVLR